jgi:hypothetical protein
VDVDASSTVNADSCSAGINLRGELRDGTPVCIRAIRPDDKERLRIAFERLSPGTVYRRFFHPRKALTTEDLRMLTELDFRDHVSLVVTVDEESGERLIAVGRFVRLAPAAERGTGSHGGGTSRLRRRPSCRRQRSFSATTTRARSPQRSAGTAIEHVDADVREMIARIMNLATRAGAA